MAKHDATFNFDHHSAEYAKNAADIYKEMRNKCPVAWTEKHGGFWVVLRYEDVAKVSHDDATFSSRHDLPPAGTAFSGITIPSGPNRATPIEMDPPEFFEYRRMLNRRFAPEAIEALKPRMVEFTDYCIDRCIESGKIDFACFPVHGLSPCARPLAPVEPKALAVSLDHGRQLHQYHGEATRPHRVEPEPQHPVDGVQAQTAAP